MMKKKIMLGLLCVALILGTMTACSEKESLNASHVAAICANPKEYFDQEITLEGQVLSAPSLHGANLYRFVIASMDGDPKDQFLVYLREPMDLELYDVVTITGEVSDAKTVGEGNDKRYMPVIYPAEVTISDIGYRIDNMAKTQKELEAERTRLLTTGELVKGQDEISREDFDKLSDDAKAYEKKKMDYDKRLERLTELKEALS